MVALAAVAASLALASAVQVETAPEVRWIVGPASVELAEGRIRCDLPPGVALAPGDAARSVLAVVAGAASGEELAVVSPVAEARTWFVVVTWRGAAGGEGRPERGESGGAGRVVWLERPTRDRRTGRVSWAFAGPSGTGPIVNRHVRIPAAGGDVQVTLVTPVEELAEAEAQLDRIVEGLEVAGRGRAPKRR
jgi:uncharacterized membrane-anchored protein